MRTLKYSHNAVHVTHPHKRVLRIRKRTIYFPIYLFNGSNATNIHCVTAAATNETESKQCRPFAGRNT